MPLLGKTLLLVENNSFLFDVRVKREALALRDAGYQVSVVAPGRRGKPLYEEYEGIHLYRFPAPHEGNSFIGFLWEFTYSTSAMLLLSFWIWISRGFDVIHTANPPDTLFIIGLIFKIAGKKFIFDHHDISPETYLSRFNKNKPDRAYRILRLLEKFSYRTADAVIATNESYKKMAMERGEKAQQQIFIVRNGPSSDWMQKIPCGQESIETGNRTGHRACYIGTMGPQDGVDYWLRSINLMVHQLDFKDFDSVIIGTGDELENLVSLAEKLNIKEHVIFTGPGRISDEDALRLLATADVCVHPDPLNPLNDKSTMNKMMEYMALGKPIVSYDLAEARFSANKAALYATPNDELDFAKKVIHLFNHPDLRSQMGEYGKTRVTEELAWEYSVPSLLKAYSYVLGREK